MCVRRRIIASVSEIQSVPKKAHTSWSVCSVTINNGSSFLFCLWSKLTPLIAPVETVNPFIKYF